MVSLLALMDLDLPVPDHTTLSRRAQTSEPSSSRQSHPEDGSLHVLIDSTGLKVFGAGEWLEDKHGARSRRSWRKLHLALDADNGEIIAHRLTDQDSGDASQVEPLLDQIDGEIGRFTADGAYDGGHTYSAVLQHSAAARIVVPPRVTATEGGGTGPPDQRGRHIRAIANVGRLKWQAATGYGKRALIETAIGRYKGLIGRRLRARSFSAQQDGGRHRLHCSQPHARLCTPGVRSLHTKQGIARDIKDPIAPLVASMHHRPCHASGYRKLCNKSPRAASKDTRQWIIKLVGLTKANNVDSLVHGVALSLRGHGRLVTHAQPSHLSSDLGEDPRLLTET
jgi:hypothetical protein